MLRELNNLTEEIREVVTNGSLLQERSTGKIALDFTLSLGQIEGLKMAIDTIRDIQFIVDEKVYEEGKCTAIDIICQTEEK